MDFATSETTEVSMVEVKIMIPLPNAATLPMAVEEIAQRICSVGNLLRRVQSRPTPIAPVTANRGGGGEKSGAQARPDGVQAKPSSVKHRDLLFYSASVLELTIFLRAACLMTAAAWSKFGRAWMAAAAARIIAARLSSFTGLDALLASQR